MTDLSYFIVRGVADGLHALLDLVKGKRSLKLFINYKFHGKELCENKSNVLKRLKVHCVNRILQ